MLDLAGDGALHQAAAEREVERRLELRLIDPDGAVRLLPLDGQRDNGFRTSTSWRPLAPAPGILRGWEVEVSMISLEEHAALGVQVVLPLDGEATGFMIPGLIYGENRRAECRLRYPRVAADPDGDSLTSDRWAFRVDRASHGVVFGWSETMGLALATEERTPLGLAGLAFRGGLHASIGLNLPAREEPVSYDGHDAAAPPEVMTHDWDAGEIASLRFLVLVLPPDRHAYDAVLRLLYRRDGANDHTLNPWVSPDEGAAIAAHGLYRWHYRSETGTLAESVAFHRDADEAAPVTGDREAMHVGWLSGAPSAHALLAHARRHGIAEYASAAVSVLDTIASGLAPCGSFWGRWTPEGWDGGWTGRRDRIHSRTIAEATLFMIRAHKLEQAHGIDHPAWSSAIESNLRFITEAQRDDGAFPSLINGQTGATESWSGAAGLLWIAALVEGSHPDAALRAGAYYARFVEDEFIYGAPEDIDLAPSSEDGYNAVIAYLALYEATSEPRWLALARRAAEWTLSFRWSYNLSFPAHTLLDAYDYRSRGADLASPRNQHLHIYGLICLPELMRLSEHSGDRYYAQRARDSLANALQFIAREDGDFNARKGMVTERYYNSRCFGPKGAILPISHAWSAGLVVYACEAGVSLDR
jgi:hypothetical protein